MVIKITLDNNCIINLLDSKSESATSVDALREIISYSHSSKIDLAVTTRVESDLESDKDNNRREEMLSHLKMFPVIGSVGRVGTSKIGLGDFIIGQEQERLIDEIQKIVFPGGIDPNSRSYKNKTNDIDHLFGHLSAKRDIFVTDDKAILKKSIELETIGIIVMSPQSLIDYLEMIEEGKQIINLKPDPKLSPGYWNKNYIGKISFDYSNNNGIFAIGKGIHLFETKWSKASDESIHTYNDMSSIDSLALVKGVNNFDDIVNKDECDYTSRSRTVSKKDMLILRNTNGIYALIKITRIEDDSRGSDKDLLEFDYKILISRELV